MSVRMTSVHLPSLHRAHGYAEYGRRPVEEMIALIRRRATQAKADAEAILAADDTDFHVETYVGILAHHDVEVLQQGACRSATPPDMERKKR